MTTATALARDAPGPLLFLIACGALVTISACSGESCNDVLVPALSVVVTDHSTGQRICNASVIASEGSYTYDLVAVGQGSDCSYAGPPERPGTYGLTAAGAGYSPTTMDGILVSSNRCHVNTHSVSLELK
jgi:hypothetical protein